METKDSRSIKQMLPKSLVIEKLVDQETARVIKKVVDESIATVLTKDNVGVVSEGVSEVVKKTLQQVAERELKNKMMTRAMAVGGATEEGLEVLKSVSEIGFPEFTSKLIIDTFNATVAAAIQQMEAYADLVSDLAKTLEQFQAENVGDAQVNAHLAERYPDGEGSTVVRADYDFQDSGDEEIPKTANDKLKEVVAALRREAPKLGNSSDPFYIDDPTNSDISFSYLVGATENKIAARIKPALAEVIAESMLNRLERMAQLGMARIVVSDGEIFTKLTFNVSTTEEMERKKTQYKRDSFNAYIKARAGWGWGSARAGARYSKLNVQTMNERNFDKVNMDAQIIGQVKLNFRSETFPPASREGA